LQQTASRGLLKGPRSSAPRLTKSNHKKIEFVDNLDLSEFLECNPAGKLINYLPTSPNTHSATSSMDLSRTHSTDIDYHHKDEKIPIETKFSINEFALKKTHTNLDELTYLPDFKLVNRLLDENVGPSSNWIQLYKDDNLRYYSHESAKGPVLFMKLFARFPGISSEKLFRLLTDNNKAKYFKDNIKETVIERINDHTEIVHVEKKMPTFMSDRDNVIVRFCIDSEKNTAVLPKYGLNGIARPFFAIYYRSIIREDILSKRNTIRSNTILHGMIIQKVDGPQELTLVRTVTHSDYKGGVPHWIMQKFAATLPKRIISSIEEAYKKWIEETAGKKL